MQIIFLGLDDLEPINPLTSPSPIFPVPIMAIILFFNIAAKLLVKSILLNLGNRKQIANYVTKFEFVNISKALVKLIITLVVNYL